MHHFDANPIANGYIWLQSYKGFDNVKDSMKQRNLNTILANISKTTSLTSDSFFLIMSQIQKAVDRNGRACRRNDITQPVERKKGKAVNKMDCFHDKIYKKQYTGV